MELYVKPKLNRSATTATTSMVYLPSRRNQEDVFTHNCDKRCGVEHVWANIYRCKLTGITHICDKHCNQRIAYDNHSCVCRVSGQVFSLAPAEQQEMRKAIVRRRGGSEFGEACAPKRRRHDAMMHPSPFECSFSFVTQLCSPGGDSMDIN